MTAATAKIVIKAPSANAPSAGNIKIPNAGENGEDLIVDFNKASKSTRNGVDEIVIDLGKQVAVSQVTINITGSRSSKNLVEISKVEFVNNVYKEIPKPKMNIPVINNFTSGTAVGNEHFVIGWDHEPNVTGYEIKIEELKNAMTIIYGRHGEIEYRFLHSSGIGVTVLVYFKLIDKVFDITDDINW